MKTLELNWTVSKARETHGYNRVSLYDGAKKYSAIGGGYDMIGTVFGEWLQENYLVRIITRCKPSEEGGFYGLHKYENKYYLDGACGLECMKAIAKEIGLEVKSIWNSRRKTTTHFIIVDNEEKEGPTQAP